MNRSNIYGFTLIELMIVVVIISIIAAVAYPSYQDSMTKTRRADGQAALLDIMNAEERFFTENNTYTTTLSDIDRASASENGYYTISASACGAGLSSCILLTATALGSQASDGNLTYNSQGVKTPSDKW